jgi:hypothetical protein
LAGALSGCAADGGEADASEPETEQSSEAVSLWHAYHTFSGYGHIGGLPSVYVKNTTSKPLSLQVSYQLSGLGSGSTPNVYRTLQPGKDLVLSNVFVSGGDALFVEVSIRGQWPLGHLPPCVAFSTLTLEPNQKPKCPSS